MRYSSDRAKILVVLESTDALREDDRRFICVILSNTSHQVQFNNVLTEPFSSNAGSPKGDGLSPLLFAIYLEAGRRFSRGCGLGWCSSHMYPHEPFEAIR